MTSRQEEGMMLDNTSDDEYHDEYHQEEPKRRKKSSSKKKKKKKKKSSKKGSSPPPNDWNSNQQQLLQEDDRIKRKMAEADRITNAALMTPPTSNRSLIDKDDMAKEKMKEADRLANLVLGVSTASAVAVAPSRQEDDTDDRDAMLKQKMRESGRLANEMLGVSVQPGSRIGSGGLDSIDEDAPAAASLAASSPVAATNSRRVMPLEPSMRRVGKVRVSPRQDEMTTMTPGAYAIEGFNAQSGGGGSSQNLLDDEDVLEPLVFEDEEDGVASETSQEEEQDNDYHHVAQFDNESHGNSDDMHSNNDDDSSMVHDLDIEEGDSDSVSTKSSAQGQHDKFYIDAQVVLATVASEEKHLRQAKMEESSVDRELRKARKRKYCRWLAVIFFMAPIAVALGLILTNVVGGDSSSSSSSTDDVSSGPLASEDPTTTLSPTTTPAPTVTPAPITIVIWLDDAPDETGWTLKCNDELVASFPLNYYSDQPGELISETYWVPDGSSCIFTLFDSFDDGLCCEAGRGFYQVYVATQEDIPNGLVAEGSEFFNTQVVKFVADLEQSAAIAKRQGHRHHQDEW